MGFFDFVSKAVNVISGIDIEHSPVVKSLANIAGVVAHALPVVGPIIDTAIPAARAIFSDDSKPPDSPPPVPASNAAPAKSDPAPPPLDIKSQILEPLDINLKKTEAQIGTVLESVNHLQSNLEEEFKQTAESLGGEILDAFNEKMKDVLDYHHHSEYINHLNAITAARDFFTQQKTLLWELTASSGSEKFDLLVLHDGKGALQQERDSLSSWLNIMNNTMIDTAYVSSQEMLDLYLLGIHWVFIMHKATIVTQGLRAKSHFANDEINSYIMMTSRIRADIDKLLADAVSAVTNLDIFRQNIKSTRQAQIKPKLTPDKAHMDLGDDWPMLSVGYMQPLVLVKKIGGTGTWVDINTISDSDKVAGMEKHQFVLLYRLTTTRIMDERLKPVEAVIESLTDSARHWRSRIPVEPLSGVEHIKPIANDAKDDPKRTSELWGKHISYAISYVNQYGEGPTSDWVQLENPLKKGVQDVTLKLNHIAYVGDPQSNVPEVTSQTGKAVQPTKAIQRRIYFRHKIPDVEEVATHFLIEVGETEKEVKHNVLDTVET